MEFSLQYSRFEIKEESTGIRFLTSCYDEENDYGNKYTVAVIDKVYNADGKEITMDELPEGLLDFVEERLGEYADWVEDDYNTQAAEMEEEARQQAIEDAVREGYYL